MLQTSVLYRTDLTKECGWYRSENHGHRYNKHVFRFGTRPCRNEDLQESEESVTLFHPTNKVLHYFTERTRDIVL